MSKQKRFNFRISDEDDATIRAKAVEATMSLTDFIVASCLGKKIIVINNIKPMIQQVRRAGITLNRLEILARQGKIQMVYLDEAQREFVKINEALTDILERRRWSDGDHPLCKQTKIPDESRNVIRPSVCDSGSENGI